MERKSIVKAFILYLSAAAFCLVFYLIYSRFSHDVSSPFMTFLFAWPLLLGALPCGIILTSKNERLYPSRLSANLYNSGVAALTIASAMKGVFDIAGTSSIHQSILMIVGISFLAFGVLIFIIDHIVKSKIVVNNNGNDLEYIVYNPD